MTPNLDKKRKHDPFKKYYGIMSMNDQDFLRNYMRYVNAVWREYFLARKHGSLKAMSMSKREEILKYYRDRLHKINVKHKTST